MTASRRASRGFTLIELMIVIAIVGILAVIAVSTYQDQIVKSRRAAAAACLQEGAQFMERYYTTNLTYVNATAPTCASEMMLKSVPTRSGPFPTVTVAVAVAVPPAPVQVSV